MNRFSTEAVTARDAVAIEASVARTLGAMLIRAMTDSAVRAAYVAACRDAVLADPIAQAIRLECRAVAQRRGIDLVRA